MLIFTARKRSLRRLCFYTCLSVHKGEYLDRYTPWDQVHSPGTRYPQGPGTPPGPGTLLGRYTPLGRYTSPLGRYTPPGAGTPPWAGTLPWEQVPPLGAVHAGRYGQQEGGTHPTGMHSCYKSNFVFW